MKNKLSLTKMDIPD